MFSKWPTCLSLALCWLWRGWYRPTKNTERNTKLQFKDSIHSIFNVPLIQQTTLCRLWIVVLIQLEVVHRCITRKTTTNNLRKYLLIHFTRFHHVSTRRLSTHLSLNRRERDSESIRLGSGRYNGVQVYGSVFQFKSAILFSIEKRFQHA